VKDGTRTRDRQGHNLELYHLSYLHRRVAVGRPRGGRIGYHRRSAAVIIRGRDRFSAPPPAPASVTAHAIPVASARAPGRRNGLCTLPARE
jgi:hypothetical protein